MGSLQMKDSNREAFEAWFLNKYQYSAEYFQITKFDADRGFYTAIDHYNPDSVNSAWVLRSSFDSWQAAKAQAVPKGFVVVKTSDIAKLAIAVSRVDLMTYSEARPDSEKLAWQNVANKLEAMIEAQEQNQ